MSSLRALATNVKYPNSCHPWSPKVSSQHERQYRSNTCLAMRIHLMLIIIFPIKENWRASPRRHKANSSTPFLIRLIPVFPHYINRYITYRRYRSLYMDHDRSLPIADYLISNFYHQLIVTLNFLSTFIVTLRHGVLLNF